MRQFINLINGNTNSLKSDSFLKQLDEVTLLEGKQYLDMFKWLDAVVGKYKRMQNIFGGTLQDAKNLCRDLRRIDRQMWAGRIIRLYLMERMVKIEFSHFILDDSDTTESELVKLFDQFRAEIQPQYLKYVTEYQRITGHSDLPKFGGDPIDYIRQLWANHYAGIEYSKIQEYKFDQTKTIAETFDDLAHLETEYKELITGLLSLAPGDKIFMKLSNQFCWVLLDRGYCKNEADAMGHCGNIGARDGDRILSLRRFNETVDGVDYYNACLTFILNHDGYLGEMKGRANEKPAERYHPMIVALLLDPIVKGIRGGGYAPENNFAMADLSEHQREELLDKKPQLGGYEHRLKKLGDTEDLRKELLEPISEFFQSKAYIEGDNIIVRQWNGLNNFISDFGNTTAKWIDDDEGFSDFYSSVSRDSVENFFDSLPLRYQIRISEYALKLVEDNEGEDALEDFDQSSTSDVISKISDFAEDSLYNPMAFAVEDGERSGAESEAHDALKKAIQSAIDSIRVGTLDIPTFERDGSARFEWDSPIKVLVTIPEACALADKIRANIANDYDDDLNMGMLFWEEENDEDVVKVDEPSYGWSGFDEDVAIERFIQGHESDIFKDFDHFKSLPAIEGMSETQLKKWISDMYGKIPDGFIRKVDVAAIDIDKLANTAKGLWNSYYGNI